MSIVEKCLIFIDNGTDHSSVTPMTLLVWNTGLIIKHGIKNGEEKACCVVALLLLTNYFIPKSLSNCEEYLSNLEKFIIKRD